MRLGILFLFVAFCSSGSTWYLDDIGTGNNDGTSWANAWRTVGAINWNSISAGDTLYVGAGSYGAMNVTKSGSAGSPITIRAAQDTATGVATFTGASSAPAIDASGRSYITVDGEYNGSRNFVFQYGALSSLYDPVMQFGTSPGTGCRVLYCTVQHGYTGVGAHNLNQQTFEVGYCYFYDIDGQAAINFVTGAASGWAEFGKILVHHNEFYYPCWLNAGVIAGIDCIQAYSGVDVYNNVFHAYYDNKAHDAQHPDCIQAQGPYWRIYNNYFFDNGDSEIDFDMFSTGHLEHLRIYNNVFNQVDTSFSPTPWHIRLYSITTTVNDVIIANNTFVDVYEDVAPIMVYQQTGIYNPTVTNTKIQNNLFYNTGPSSGDSAYIGLMNIHAAANFVAADWGVDYNLTVAGPDGTANLYVDGSAYTQPHPRTGTPSFARYVKRNYTTDTVIGGGISGLNDFRLAAGDTAAKDQGVDLSAYFTTDKDGNTRTGTWDIGAYEYGESEPAAPSISVQPTSQTNVVGQTVTFTVTASGNPSPSYQWKWEGTNAPTGTSATWVSPALTAEMNGSRVWVTLTNTEGYLISNTNYIGVSSFSESVWNATASWTGSALPQATNSVSFSFRVFNSVTNTDLTIGFSPSVVGNYTDLGPIVRFADTGLVDARNGADYAAVNQMYFSANTWYLVSGTASIPNHTYSVTVNGTVIASNYAFRSEQSACTELDNIGLVLANGTGIVSNLTWSTSMPSPNAGVIRAKNVKANRIRKP